ncbi:MAG: hypothetical protein Q4F24_08120 [Eubacteriales bacterium]|nr:hypothetical protein [Eubacteriales bacterium]
MEEGLKLIKEAAEAGASAKPKEELIMKLHSPFHYAGEEIKELNLTGLYDLKAKDLVQIDDMVRRTGDDGSAPEMSKRYALLVTAKVMDKPFNFCYEMDARDAVRLKNVVAGFFYTLE